MGRYEEIPRPFPGPGQCNWCGKPLKDPRQRWCSQPHSDEFWIRASESYARGHVARRDGGICALCGADTQHQRKVASRLSMWGARHREWYVVRFRPGLEALLRKKWGIPRGRLNSEWWDMDHTVPLVEGGARDLSNLRTLCIRCHAGETRALAQRRKSARTHALDLLP